MLGEISEFDWKVFSNLFSIKFCSIFSPQRKESKLQRMIVDMEKLQDWIRCSVQSEVCASSSSSASASATASAIEVTSIEEAEAQLSESVSVRASLLALIRCHPRFPLLLIIIEVCTL